MKIKDIDFIRECVEDLYDNQDELNKIDKRATGWRRIVTNFAKQNSTSLVRVNPETGDFHFYEKQ